MGEGEDARRGRKGNSDSINYMSGRAPEVSNVHPANKLVIGMSVLCACAFMAVRVRSWVPKGLRCACSRAGAQGRKSSEGDRREHPRIGCTGA